MLHISQAIDPNTETVQTQVRCYWHSASADENAPLHCEGLSSKTEFTASTLAQPGSRAGVLFPGKNREKWTSNAMQQQFGFPPLTDEVKAQVFGLNAARLSGLTPAELALSHEDDAVARIRAELTDSAAVRPRRVYGALDRRQFLRMVAHQKQPIQPWNPKAGDRFVPSCV